MFRGLCFACFFNQSSVDTCILSTQISIVMASPPFSLRLWKYAQRTLVDKWVLGCSAQPASPQSHLTTTTLVFSSSGSSEVNGHTWISCHVRVMLFYTVFLGMYGQVDALSRYLLLPIRLCCGSNSTLIWHLSTVLTKQMRVLHYTGDGLLCKEGPNWNFRSHFFCLKAIWL